MQYYFVTTKYLDHFNKTLTYRYFDQKIWVLRLRIWVLRLRVTNPTAFKNQPTAFKNNKKRKTNLTTDYNRLRILAGQPLAFND
jgi:hypothetical protein